LELEALTRDVLAEQVVAQNFEQSVDDALKRRVSKP